MEHSDKLIVICVDALPDGAEIGDVIRNLYAWNARHVQVMSTVTRHNRTGYTVLVEIAVGDEWHLARSLAREYGIARYHQLASVLRYQPVAQGKRPIVATHHEKQFGLTVRFELIGTEQEPLFVRVPDDDLKALHARIAKELDVDVTAADVRDRLEALLMNENGFVLELA